MTVSAPIPTSIQIPGNGFATVFVFPQKVFAASDLLVGFITNGAYVLQSGGYQVSNIDINGSCTVTFSVAPPLGVTVDLRTSTPQTQGTDFSNLGPYLPESTTDTCDRIVRMVQDLTRQTYLFGIHGPDTESTAWPALPDPDLRGGGMLVFDDAGLPTLGIPTTQPLTASLVTQFLGWGATAVETALGIIPANTLIPPHTIDGIIRVDRYGLNTVPGTTSMFLAWQTAINVGKSQGGVVTWGVGPYLIDAALDLTNPVGSQNCMFALIGQGRFKAPTANVGQNATPSILLKHAGHAFDTTGSIGIHFENMSIAAIDNTIYPQTCFLRARNSDGSSRSDRLINCYVIGKFHKTIDYNYGSENDVIDGCQFYNFATDANTAVCDITGFNFFRAITSTFTTIATGSQSCLDHKIIGGEFANFGGQSTSDVFRWDGAHSVKVFSPWMDCATQDGSVSGRSLIYIDGTNGPTQLVTLSGIDGEAQTHAASYGILVSANAQTHGPILVMGNTFPNSQAMLGGGTGATISGLTWINSSNSSTGGTINFSGTLLSPQFDSSAGTVVAGTIDNFSGAWNVNQTIQRSGAAGLNLRDFSQASGSQWIRVQNGGAQFQVAICDDNGVATSFPLLISHTGIGFNNSSAVAKPSVTGSKGANAALASLLTALASMGLITDSSS